MKIINKKVSMSIIDNLNICVPAEVAGSENSRKIRFGQMNEL
jgi:hypothetical protein